MSIHLLTRYGLTRLAEAPEPSTDTGSTAFAVYATGVIPSDWTPSWNTTDITYTVRGVADDVGSTDFAGYTSGVQPSDWTPAWNTTDIDYTVEEA